MIDPFQSLTKEEARARRKTTLVTSASAIKDLHLCERLWYFKKVLKLPVQYGDGTGAAFGTVLHEVIERYLGADDLGRDRETGKPVDLYPDGWAGDLPDHLQQLVRVLMEKALDEGVILRTPNARIEQEFWLPVDDDAWVMGYIDLLPTDEEVLDHKNSKSTRYFLGVKRMKRDTQLSIYGYALQRHRVANDKPPLLKVPVGHNQFLRDPTKPLVRKTRVEIPAEQIEAFWNGTVTQAVKDMRRLKTVPHWRRIPEPNDENACQKYGGCKFLHICFGNLTPEMYRHHVEGTGPAADTPQRKEQKRMNPLEKLKQRAAQLAAQSPEPEPAQAQAQATIEAEPEVPLSDKPAAPWSNATCVGCSKDDVAVRGVHPDRSRTCGVCRVKNQKKGLPIDRDFVITFSPAGLAWEARGEMVKDVSDAIGPDSLEGSIAFPDVKVQDVDEGMDCDDPRVLEYLAKKDRERDTFTESEAELLGVDIPSAAEPEFDPQTASDGEVMGALKALAETETPAPVRAIPGTMPEPFSLTKKDIQTPRGVEPATGKGRRKASYGLFTGCEVVTGYSTVYRAENLLFRLGEKVAAAHKVESYYLIDDVTRQDVLRALVPQLDESLRGSIVVFPNAMSADLAVLYEALAPGADRIVKGVSR